MTKTMIILPHILLTKAEHQDENWLHSSIKENQPQTPLEEIIWSTSVPGGTKKYALILPDRYLSNLFLNPSVTQIPQSP